MEALDTAQFLGLLVAVVLPLLVGLVTTQQMGSGVKAVLLAFLAALTGFLTELLEAVNSGEVFSLQAALMTWLAAFLVAVGTHYGLWKPTGVTAKAQATGVTPKGVRRRE